jgi:hypothetical protein
LLGDFPAYLAKDKQFTVPVYAVWGNHEDIRVIQKIQSDPCIPNLHLLDENIFYQFPHDNDLAFSLYGLGGNFLVNKKLFDSRTIGGNGKVWSTLHQFGTLYQRIKNKGKASIFVSHVSPGKEPLLTALLTHFMPNFWISGHMGAPYACVWNQFTIREMNESLDWLKSNIDSLDQYIEEAHSPETKLAFDLIKQPIPKKDYWKMWNINLPDAKDGYALLRYNQGRFALETYARGITISIP